MADKVIVDREKLTAIADAVRSAEGTECTYSLEDVTAKPAIWQGLIAEAITAKGVDTADDVSFDDLALAIRRIEGQGNGNVEYFSVVPSEMTDTITVETRDRRLVTAYYCVAAKKPAADAQKYMLWQLFSSDINPGSYYAITTSGTGYSSSTGQLTEKKCTVNITTGNKTLMKFAPGIEYRVAIIKS